ncbi:hypothetical protein RvVAT039_08900 [Agrobacterium vitis]|uniref:hypothetical protein n=1 Tax=Agrobacterium vitis TaxID=373 RepID=UPI0015D9EF89|nr:hypothetical protein [Agrobacterium vitis]BCH63674.1 hypothetical protein RvVAT039_08900 [Agrobacterium vitis]
MKKITVILLYSVFLSSCGTSTPKQIADPSNITLRTAIFDVATTLRDVKDISPPDKKTGLMADEATVTFNIAASSKTTNNAELKISDVRLAEGIIGGTLGSQNITEGSTGNQIVVKFKNITTADMSKGIYSVLAAKSSGKSNTTPKEKTEPKRTSDNPEKPSNRPDQVIINIATLCELTGACALRGDIKDFKLDLKDKSLFKFQGDSGEDSKSK